MWEAGQVVAAALRAAAEAVAPVSAPPNSTPSPAPGSAAAGAVPSFLGYHGFPATICTCINDEIVHGIPSASRVLQEGDVVSIDCGASVEGWHADAALTVGVGAIHGGTRQADRRLRAGALAGPGRRPGRRAAVRHLARGGAQRAGGR